ncbi:hypothetical protein, partial [uncultured Desulfovibrio sp.]|uniref:hypothetical protein n=1 Tax=uncultured Desulfovibrio sp. TaxID=167968 RepID=UPI002804910D
ALPRPFLCRLRAMRDDFLKDIHLKVVMDNVLWLCPERRLFFDIKKAPRRELFDAEGISPA